jgi:hypothetical protein
LPVGNSDRGVGLFGGQMMIAMDYNYQFIDWGHDEIEGEQDELGNHVGNHIGTLSANIFEPKITVGLTDYWNITMSQIVGTRYMTWGKDIASIHHENSNSKDDQYNAIGGYLGDTQLMLRYLAINDGAGPGKRLFMGGGISIPSENTLTSDPFFLSNPSEETYHRHFSMSQGVYLSIFEIQYFIKRLVNPVFLGGSLLIQQPISESDYGFTASRLIDLSLTAFTDKINWVKGSVGGNLSFRNTNQAYWNDKSAPNSKSLVITPGLAFIWNMDAGAVALNIQKPTFISGSMSGNDESSQEETEVIQISISVRKILDYSIPWLYW